MTPVSLMPNIGKVLAQKLETVGIKTDEDLKNMGSENAFIRLKTIENDACIQMLWALEGAIEGTRWHNLSKQKKDNLKHFYNLTMLKH